MGARLVAAFALLAEQDVAGARAQADVVRELAGRLAAAREAVGVVSYRLGDYEQAVRDLRAARRIGGGSGTLPLVADSERGRGRPDLAIELARSDEVTALDQADRMELVMVAAGARQDLGEPEAAVLTLQVPELRQESAEMWQPRLWAAYAAALEESGRGEDAVQWWTRARAHPEWLESWETGVAPPVSPVPGRPGTGDVVVDLDPDGDYV